MLCFLQVVKFSAGVFQSLCDIVDKEPRASGVHKVAKSIILDGKSFFDWFKMTSFKVFVLTRDGGLLNILMTQINNDCCLILVDLTKIRISITFPEWPHMISVRLL